MRAGALLRPPPAVLAEPPAGSGLAGVPGDRGLPLIGYSVQIQREALAFGRWRYDTYGPVSWGSMFGVRLVGVLGPDGTEAVLVNRDKAFSQAGWSYFIGPFFRRGLMLLDFTEHHYHRRIMQDAFTRDRLAGYLDAMQPGLAAGVKAWEPAEGFSWYDAMKHLLLRNATDVFVGVELGDRQQRIFQAFLDTVRAGLSVVRKPVPGGRWAAGLRGRRVLEEFFSGELPAKRASRDADLFSVLCRARSEDGEQFSDADVVNHMIFLLMAAHDTTTIAMASIGYQLARHPDWQERLRAEVLAAPEQLSYADLDALPSVDLVTKESLRLLSPVHVMPRKAVKDTEVLGHHIPAGTFVNVSPWFNHTMGEYWPDPLRFDPERFAEHRREDKVHRYAWAPFGGGVHKCIGMSFGTMQIKATLNQLLRQYRWSVPAGYEMPVDTRALPVPADKLPVRLERL
ncbi:MAG: cytochrome P450 [Pseudonocardiales bacterium]|nr:cytochrome P450 [Pseudonocardiales bacterium]